MASWAASTSSLVGQEVVKGEVLETGVFGASDPVLGPSASPMARLELNDVLVRLVGDEDLEAISVGIGEPQLGAGMGPLTSTDGSRTGWPGAELRGLQFTDGTPSRGSPSWLMASF